MKSRRKLAGVRERLLDTADELFRRGIRSVGVDTVVAEAREAKMSLYRHLKGKYDLVTAVLERGDGRTQGRLMAEAERPAGAPADRLAAFNGVGDWFATADFRWRAFVNAAALVAEPSDAGRSISPRHYTFFREYLSGVAAGAIVGAVVDPAADPAATAGRTARAPVAGAVNKPARRHGGGRF